MNWLVFGQAVAAVFGMAAWCWAFHQSMTWAAQKQIKGNGWVLWVVSTSWAATILGLIMGVMYA